MEDLIQVILNRYFNYGYRCGPNDHAYEQYFESRTYFSSVLKEVPHLVADQFYHPEIRVCIDFSHQFVFTGEKEGMTGKRPVSKQRLQDITRKLASYVYYYFEYVLSINDTTTEKLFSDIASTQDEKKMVIFINTIMNYFLTSVNVDRSRNGIGSATVVIKDNNNYKNGKKINVFNDRYMSILEQLFVPMLPISIWARGRLYKDWYFPIFDGYTIMCSPSTAQGYASLNITCKDTLELARISQEMLNPAILQIKEFEKQTAINIFSKPLYGQDHLVIFDTMIHGGLIRYREPEKDEDGNYIGKGGGEIVSPEDILSQIPRESYSTQELLSLTSLGNFVRADDSADGKNSIYNIAEDKFIYKDNFNMRNLVEKTSHIYRQRATVAWGEKITPYRMFNFQTPQIYTSEFSSRLDVLRDVAGMVYYELYVDGYGTINYHPMRLSNDYFKYDIIAKEKHEHCFFGVQTVGADEIISTNVALNLEEMVTFLRLHGKHVTLTDTPPEQLEIVGSAVDKRLMERYGYRRREVENPMFNVNEKIHGSEISGSSDDAMHFLDIAAHVLMRYMNAELHTNNTTLVFRPELELALPVVFPDNNNVFYINSISHSITVGGDASTTISCSFGRLDSQHPADLSSFMLATEAYYTNSPDFIATFEAAQDSYKLSDFTEGIADQSVPAGKWIETLDNEDYIQISASEEGKEILEASEPEYNADDPQFQDKKQAAQFQKRLNALRNL